MRPIKCRKIYQKPSVDVFKPSGIPLDQLQIVNLSVDEFETIRLADLEGLYQEQAAEQMNISRQTFGNILALAHRKIADILVNTKALHISGGVVTLQEKLFRCSSCHHQWAINDIPSICPSCGNTSIYQCCHGVNSNKKRCRKFCRRIKHEYLHPGQEQ